MEKQTFAYFKKIHHKAYAQKYAHEKEWESEMKREWEELKGDKEAYKIRLRKMERDSRGSNGSLILDEIVTGRKNMSRVAT